MRCYVIYEMWQRRRNFDFHLNVFVTTVSYLQVEMSVYYNCGTSSVEQKLYRVYDYDLIYF